MGTRQLSGQGLSALASLSWKSPAPVSRWLGAQRPLGSLSPTLSHWLSATAPGIRRSDHREARAAFAAVSSHPRAPSTVSWRVPASAPGAASLFSRDLPVPRALLAHPAPRAGSILGKVSAHGAVLARVLREPPRPLPAGGRSRPLEPERALERERLSHGVGVRSPGSGCKGTAAGAASSRAAGSRSLPRLVGAAAADRGRGSQPPHLRGRGVGSAAGERAGAEESVRLQAGAPAWPPRRRAAAAGRCRRRGPRSTGRS